MKKYYLGMDVHKATIAIAVLDAFGKLIAQSIIETSTQAVRDFFGGLRGEVHVTFEEGNHAAWLYDMAQPLVKRVVVCNPKHNRKLMDGSKNDPFDARKLAELLRLGAVKAIYHGEHGTRTLKHLMRCYECLIKDITRVQNRREERSTTAKRSSTGGVSCITEVSARPGSRGWRILGSGHEPSCSSGRWMS